MEKNSIFFALEVFIDCTIGYTCPLGNLRDACGLEIFLAKDFDSCIDNGFFSSRFLGHILSVMFNVHYNIMLIKPLIQGSEKHFCHHP